MCSSRKGEADSSVGLPLFIVFVPANAEEQKQDRNNKDDWIESDEKTESEKHTEPNHQTTCLLFLFRNRSDKRFGRKRFGSRPFIRAVVVNIKSNFDTQTVSVDAFPVFIPSKNFIDV